MQLESDRRAGCRRPWKFQSHIGAIRIYPLRFSRECGANFNPTLVQLEFTCWKNQSLLMRYFNPTLVQLESLIRTPQENEVVGFQSHIGAIRIKSHSPLDTEAQAFQSHIGAIRIWDAHHDIWHTDNFNPTLVQLECQSSLDANRNLIHFNPTLVQLEFL